MEVAGNYAKPDWMLVIRNSTYPNSNMGKADLKYKNRCEQDRARASGMRVRLTAVLPFSV